MNLYVRPEHFGKMSNYLTIESPLRGRLGNQLFQINLLHQLASQFQLEPLYPKSLVSKLCIGFESTGQWRKYLQLRLQLSKSLIVDSTHYELRNVIMAGKQGLRLLVLPSGILGEVFNKFSFQSVKEIFHPDELFLKEVSENNSENIAIHFRGSDFEDWNPTSVMSKNYYFQALEKADWHEGSEVHIFTEDPQHPTVEALLKSDSNIILRSSKRELSDFWTLSTYSQLISGPSTFSIWAAMLGSNSVLTLSKKWVAERSELNERFWIEIAKNELGVFEEIRLA